VEGALRDNTIFSSVYDFVLNHVVPDGWDGWEWAAYGIAAMSVIMLVVNSLFALTTWYTYFERRLLGRFQNRIGPNRAGPFGLLQPIADAIKLLTKEDTLPRASDRLIFNVAPVLMLATTFMIVAVIPFGEGSFLADLNIGILYISGVSSMAVIAILMAGWASANKYAMFGSMRAVAALISYEIPVVLSLLSVVILTGSMSLVDIVEGQSLPYLLVLPLAFLVFVVGISAELNRPPFDLAEAESEIIAGYHTEYSGMKFGIFQLAEFANVLLASAIITLIFLQGWRWAILPSHLWFLLKVFGTATLFIWIRATLPRLRIDQVLAFAWKFLLPLGLINVLAAAIEKLVWADPSNSELLLMATINWGVAIVAVAVFATAVNNGRHVPVHTVIAGVPPGVSSAEGVY
jgi:NADH-quinone oxidoreductase subunit H